MKKLLFSLLSILLFTACKKESTLQSFPLTDNSIDEVAVKIGTQKWMPSNLNVIHYRNGDHIRQVTDQTKWDNLTTGAWCYYNNDPANGAVYGKLYNWYAVHDPRGLAPAGWHIPSDSEWTVLSLRLGGDTKAGGRLKDTGTIEAGTGLWRAPNTGATNRFGFTGLPGGCRGYLGSFHAVGEQVFWWSSTDGGNETATCRTLVYYDGTIYREFDYRQFGYSVRCIKD